MPTPAEICAARADGIEDAAKYLDTKVCNGGFCFHESCRVLRGAAKSLRMQALTLSSSSPGTGVVKAE